MYLLFKRVFDIIFSFFFMVLFIPIFLLIAALIKINSKGTILFKQKRIGKNKKYFNILKFRTMYSETPNDVPTHVLDKPYTYITSIGKYLRKSSLDELPQLLNIFKGEMSFIGPRPALWNQYDLIKERDEYGANNILPGLTGWAQINGRDVISIEEKAKFDGEYVNRMSFIFDFKILVGTIFSILKSDGIKEGESNKTN